VGHLRWHLSGIFKLAMPDGVVDHNPAGKLFVADCKPEGEKRVMSQQDIRLALSVFSLRDRLIFRMAVFDGMRPGEIFGIRLGKLSGTRSSSISACTGGRWTARKGVKARKRLG
jgi:integrase